MQLKKIALVFLVVIMMFSLAAIAIAAEEPAPDPVPATATITATVEAEGLLSPTDVVVKPGTIINYVVNVEASATFSSFEVRVKYDSEELELLDVVDGDLFETGVQKDVSKPGYVQVIRWVGNPSTNKNGTLFTLQFKVSEGSHGTIDSIEIKSANLLEGDNFFESTVINASDVMVHTLGDATKTEGDCLNVGTTVYTCTLEGCDYELVLHDGELGEHILVKTENAGDCLNKATTVYTCSREGCGYSYVVEGELGEHSLVKTENPGDCKNVATTVHTCSREGCDYELVEKGELGNHNLVKVERVEPTYEAAGCEEHYKCSLCDKLFDAEGKEISYPSIPQLEKKNNTVVTVIIIVVAVVVVAAGAAVAVIVLKKKKII